MRAGPDTFWERLRIYSITLVPVWECFLSIHWLMFWQQQIPYVVSCMKKWQSVLFCYCSSSSLFRLQATGFFLQYRCHQSLYWMISLVMTSSTKNLPSCARFIILFIICFVVHRRFSFSRNCFIRLKTQEYGTELCPLTG